MSRADTSQRAVVLLKHLSARRTFKRGHEASLGEHRKGTTDALCPRQLFNGWKIARKPALRNARHNALDTRGLRAHFVKHILEKLFIPLRKDAICIGCELVDDTRTAHA